MPRTLLPGRNPHVRNFMHTNGHGAAREVAFECESEVEPVLAHARYLRDCVAASPTPLRHRLGKVLSVVPIDVWVRAQREGWDDRAWDRWRRDPENAGLQVQR